MEEGEPRYGLVQLSNSGSAYNVTLNLTGSILMGLGISLALLLYLFQNSMNESSASSGSSGYNDHRRFLRLQKRALDDEEKAMVEMLYRILSSLSEEQVDDNLKRKLLNRHQRNKEYLVANPLAKIVSNNFYADCWSQTQQWNYLEPLQRCES